MIKERIPLNKRFLSLCLVLALVLGLFTIAPTAAHAESQMTASENCLNVIKELEGFSGKPYKDTDGKYTIGYGTRCPDELVSKYKNNPMTKEEADAELRKEVVSYETAVNAFIDRHGLTFTQGQFDGVVSLVFNCGNSWLTKGETLIEALAGGATGNELIYAFSIYSMSAGKRSVGHIKRRLAEANMYLNEEYGRTPPEHFSYVLYQGNGGTVDTYDVQGYDTKLTAAPVATATYPEYTFLGWYTAAVGGEKVTILDENTKGITLYAQWSKGGESTSKPDTDTDSSSKPEVDSGSTSIAPLKIKVTGSNVNLRKGPGLSYDVLKTVSKGTELTIIAVCNEGKYIWGRSMNGWIRLDNTDYEDRVKPPVQEPEKEPEKEPDKEPVTTPTVTKVYGTVIGTDTLNVRKTPDGTIVGKLNKGDKVEILEQKTVNDRAWGRISNGWICLRSYVQLQTVTVQSGTTPSTPTNPTTQKKLYGTIINTSSQNVRNAPDGTVVGKLLKGERFEILERKTVSGREWGRCSKGWVCLRTYVKLEEVTVNTGTSGSQPGGTTTVTTKTYATVTGIDSLNVRVTPDGAVCGSLTRGTKVEILERKTVSGREWGRCSKGWICLRTYAKVETVTVNSATSKQVGKVTASALNIRSGAGMDYSVVGKLYKGESVEILEKKTVSGTTWGKCSKGWVSLEYIQF